MISFVGAGPGASDLITLRGAARLRAADVVVWASSLVPREVLDHVRPGVQVHDSAVMTLEDVLDLYAAHPDASIVRLHSGDPSLYGAIQEQIDWCRTNGRRFEIVPGVSSVGAAAAAVGRELTLPGVSQAVVATRLAGRTSASMPPNESLSAYAALGGTIAVLLSAARPVELQAALLANGSAFEEDTPAAVVIRASWEDEQVIRTTIGSLARDLARSGATTTAIVLVGEALRDERAGSRSRLYDPAFAHARRRRSAPGSTRGRPA